MSETFEPWRTLAGKVGRSLLEEAAAMEDLRDPAAVARLRKLAEARTPDAADPAELVRAAIEITRARHKAAAKFDQPHRLIADPPGIEQATSADVAIYKARRFAEAGIETVADLCCGIGGDAIGLAASGLTPLLIDRAPAKAWMARYNVEVMAGRRCPAAAADVTELDLHGIAFHLDPARRSTKGRALRFADYEPGPALVETLVQRGLDGAIKLSPAIDLTALPPGEVEIINRGGTLVQAVLWTGRLARHERSATRLDSSNDTVHTLGGPPDAPGSIPVTEHIARYVMAIDPAVERAGLVGLLCDRLGASAVHPALGLLSADDPIDSPWLTPFELIERMPWRSKRVKAWLKAHDGGIVEVKTRGKAVDPDRAQKQLRGSGATRYTVFVLRFGKRAEAWITRRC